MSETPYQVYLYVGSNPPTAPQGVTAVDVTPVAPTAEAALSTLEGSGLTAADLRTRVLLIVDPQYSSEAVLVYAALCGFAGRRVDFTDLTEVVDVRSLHTAAAEAPDLGKPDSLPEFVQIGAEHPDTSLLSFPALDTLTPSDVTSIRFARHCRLALNGRSAKEALTLLVAASGLRTRNGADRMPTLVLGDETFIALSSDDAPALPVAGIDLDALRRAASEARRSRRTDDRGFRVDPVALTDRQEYLIAASRVPAEQVLQRLGSFVSDETGFWRCPRPERHKNGDANPSTRVSDGMVRCFRCDLEPVDTLRLVMDCKGLSPDESASWILSS